MVRALGAFRKQRKRGFTIPKPPASHTAWPDKDLIPGSESL